MELEEAIKKLEEYSWIEPEVSEAIEVVLKELDRKDKVIDEITNWIDEHEDPFEGCHVNGKCENENIPCKKCIKQYFYKKVEEQE